jgi:hypothetical protein
MTPKGKVILTVVVFAVIGFVIQSNAPVGQLLWPPSAELPAAAGAQIPLFMLYSIVAAIGFGLGMAFLIYGRPLVAALGLSNGMTWGIHLAIFWVLGNWAIHDSLHITNGHNLWGLVAIEYGFHVTMILAGAVIALGLLQVARRALAPARTASAPHRGKA